MRARTMPVAAGIFRPADSGRTEYVLEAEFLEIRGAAVEVCRVLEGLADPEHVALHEGLAQDLDTDRQAVREAARHREPAQAEIVARPRELGRDRRGLVDLAERDRGAGHRWSEQHV